MFNLAGFQKPVRAVFADTQHVAQVAVRHDIGIISEQLTVLHPLRPFFITFIPTKMSRSVGALRLTVSMNKPLVSVLHFRCALFDTTSQALGQQLEPMLARHRHRNFTSPTKGHMVCVKLSALIAIRSATDRFMVRGSRSCL